LEQANADHARMLGIWLNACPAPPGLDISLFRNARLSPKIQPLSWEIVGDAGDTLWLIMGTLSLVLLIVCANVANLRLVRAEGRHQELAIRAALGAGWGRIAREILVESITLGVLGGAFGLALAFLALRILVAEGPATLPRLGEIAIDSTVFAFALGISLFSGLLFGVIPILKYAGPQITTSLRGIGRTFSQDRARHRARNTLVVIQTALAVVLLIASGLMIRSFQHLRNVFHTFDLSLETSPPARSKPVSAPVARTFLFFELLDPTSAQESLKRAIQSSRAEHDPPVAHLLNIFHDGVSMTRLLRQAQQHQQNGLS